MNAAVGLMDGLGLDGDRCIRVIPRQADGKEAVQNEAAIVDKKTMIYNDLFAVGHLGLVLFVHCDGCRHA